LIDRQIGIFASSALLTVASYSCNGMRLALRLDASQQIGPGLGEGCDPFSEQLCVYGICINTSFGEFGQHIIGMRGNGMV